MPPTSDAQRTTHFVRSRLAFALLPLALAAGQAQAAEIRHVTPQGEAKRVLQVSVNFNEPVRPLGDISGPAPVTWSCSGVEAKGKGRWVDTQTWVLDFSATLPAGVRCELKPAAELKDLAGKPVKAEPAYRFHTGGPNIESVYAGRSSYGIDEEAVFLVTATGPIDFSTVEPNAWCQVEGLGEKVPVKQLTAAEKTALLTQRKVQTPPDRIAALRCARRLPNGMKVTLVWGKGIKGSTGLATSAAETKEFKVRPEFTVTVSCERENANTDCVPITPILLRFTAAVRREDVAKIKLVGPGGKKWNANIADDDRESEFVDYVQFIGPFPPEAQFTLDVPPQIRDDAGRVLTNRDRLAKVDLKTSPYPPLLKFAADFGIVERNAGGLLPVTVRNLEAAGSSTAATADGSKPGTAAKLRLLRITKDEDVLEWLRNTRDANSYTRRAEPMLKGNAQAKTLLLPKPNGPKPMEVVGIPLGEPGFYVLEAESQKLGERLLDSKDPMYVRTTAVNTNLSVHFKKGEENQLIWVTTLDTGKPVANARISVRGCDGKQLAFGNTGADGTMMIRRRLPAQTHCKGLWGYHVFARSGDDYAFVSSDWQKGIETWRYKLPYGGVVPDVMTHTVFDRPLFRAGETVHMKHLARRHTTGGFALAQRAQLPDKIAIQLEGSDLKFELPLTWKNGSAESTWTIPPDAKLGKYWVTFAKAGQNVGRVEGGEGGEGDGEEGWMPPGYYWRGGSFKVGEFRLPVLRGEVAPASKAEVASKEVNVDLRLSYLAGGAAGNEKVRVRSEIRPANLKPPLEFEGYVFGSPPVDPAALKTGADYAAVPEASVFNDQRDLLLDKTGTRRVPIKDVPQWTVPADLYAEMEYSDPSGEIHTVGGTVPWFPAGVVAGITADEWATATDQVQVKLAALDTLLKPRSDTPYTVRAWYKKTFVHRKRLVGGFYSYDSRHELVDLGEVCKGSTDRKGAAVCEFKPPKTEKFQQGGEVILEMRAADASNRLSYAHTSVWIGEGEIWFDQDASDRIDVIPEKKRYEPGDTAVFQVRMPFREATALVSVEREGVVDRFVQPLTGRDPTVKVPIKPNYGPNVFVSVFVVRGRVGDVQPTALVDLGKPAYKMGIGEIFVGHKGYELTVKVEPEKAVYKTREEAVAKIRVTKPDGTPAKGGEFALAAVDEALLQLARNDSWYVLPRLMARRGYSIETATAQTQVIGKRHFGLKALPAGGGGGRQPTRELFDTLIKWEARVVLDDNGEAKVRLPLNDSLTTIRIVAVAQQGTGLFGTGFARIRSTKDVQLFAGLPPLVRDTDQFRAAFTVRNLTDRKDSFTVNAAASAQADGEKLALPALPAQTVTLEPGEAREVAWPLTVPPMARRIDWLVSAQAGQSGSQDALKVNQKVGTALPVRVLASTLEQLNGSLSVPVKLPSGGLAERGSIDVLLKPKLGASSDSVREYMERYPYACLEQKVSKAIGTASQQRWSEIMGRLPTYLDNNGLAGYFPNPLENRGSVVLTAYLLAAAHEGGYAVPEAAQNRMLEGLAAFVEGRIKDDQRHYWSPKPDLPVRKLAAIEALSRHGRATPQHVASVPVTPGLWPTGAVIDWLNILNRMNTLPNRDKQIAEAEGILRTRMVSSGTLTQFNTETNDYWWWLMVSPDSNAARAIATLMDRPGWEREIPRLVRGVMARQHEGHWNTTTANVWGVLMLDKFARKFENEPVTGTTAISVKGSATPAQSADWSKYPEMEAGKAKAVAAGQAPVPPAGSGWRDPGEPYRFAWPAGGSGTVELQQQGSGRPWATVQARAARHLTGPVYQGFEVKKTVTPIEQKTAGRWTKGDLVQVSLEVNAPATWTWVVVNDPIPAGATIVGSLGRDSQQTVRRPEDERTPSFAERAFDGYRAYYEYLPKGALKLSYRFRLNNAGEFTLPATRVEAMYAPENFGEVPNEKWKVE